MNSTTAVENGHKYCGSKNLYCQYANEWGHCQLTACQIFRGLSNGGTDERSTQLSDIVK